MADFPGTAGDDLIDGTVTADTIADGGAGNDTLNGNDGDDVITSSGGTDSIDGGAGTDRLVINVPTLTLVNGSTVTGIGSGTFTIGGALLSYQNIEGITYNGSVGSEIVIFGVGNHIINLSGGNDELSVADGTVAVDGSSGTDGLYLNAVSAGVILSGAGIITGSTLNGSISNVEFVDGTAFGDTLVGSTITSTLSGGDGNDILDSGTATGTIVLNGGNGDDILIVRSSGNVIVAAVAGAIPGHDRVETDRASFTLPTGTEDLEYFGITAFTGTGNSVANVIVGGDLGDTLTGLGGNDNLGGEAGDDILDGGDGNDRLFGGTGADSMNGGAGNDILVVDNAGDVANGGAGSDTVQIVTAGLTYTIASDIEIVSNQSNGGATVTLNALANTYGGGNSSETVIAGGGDDIVYLRGGNDGVFGGMGNDRLFGEAGFDNLLGEEGNDFLYGGSEGDSLFGGAGNDTLYGEAGDDQLNGGAGIDILNGGAGADQYFFGAGDSGSTIATADRIQGFSSAQGDFIDLSATGLSSFIGGAAFGNVAGQVRTQVIGGNTFVMGDVDGNGVADFIVRIDGIVMLSGGDFVFIGG